MLELCYVSSLSTCVHCETLMGSSGRYDMLAIQALHRFLVVD
jgi:hypothetical protein